MGERVASWFAVVLMGCVLATSYWYAQTLREPGGVDAGRIGEVDFFAQGVALTGFDDAGRPRYRMFADTLTHYGNSDDFDLVRPRMLSLRPDQPQLQATAETAHAQENGRTVQMRGNVVVTRAADGTRPPLQMETQALTAVPDDDHFWTEAPVHLQSGHSVMDALSMDFDNIARRIKLDGNVTGAFPPRERP